MWKCKGFNPQNMYSCYVFSAMASKMNESKALILMLSPSGEVDSKLFLKQELTGERERNLKYEAEEVNFWRDNRKQSLRSLN